MIKKLIRLTFILAGLGWLGPAGAATAAPTIPFLGAVYDSAGLKGVRAVAVSPDGRYLYATGFEDDAVLVFSRDEATDRLTLVQIQRDDSGAVDGLNGASSITISPDPAGRHLYVTGQVDNAVAVFSRHETTGMLRFVESHTEDLKGAVGLNGAVSAAISPDGRSLYVAGLSGETVAVFNRNTTTGALRFVERQKDGLKGVDGLDGAASVTISPDGRHLYVAGSLDDAAAVFSREAGTGALRFVEVQKNGLKGVEGLNGARSVAISPDGRYVYVASWLDHAVAVFNRDVSTGMLRFVERQKDGLKGVDGLLGAGSVTISPDGGRLYAAGRLDDAVAVFDRDAGAGTLTFVERQKDGLKGVDGLAEVRMVVVSPDGRRLYAAGAGDEAVAVFSRDETTGGLNFRGRQTGPQTGVDGLAGARAVIVSADNRHLYATGGADDAVVLFSRDQNTGALTFVELHLDGRQGVDGLAGAASVTISGDGRFLYAAGQDDNAVAVFGRDPATGRLRFVEVHTDGRQGVDGLAGAASITISPDDRHLYAAGAADDAVAVFSRDPATGLLNFIEVHTDGRQGVDGLAGAASVALSPDGRHLYAAGAADDAAAVFSREAGSGTLRFVERQKERVAGVEGLFGAASVTVSPDGLHLYAAGAGDDAVAVFSREAASGALGFIEFVQDGLNGVEGLNGVRQVTISPDGRYLYAVGPGDDAAAVFSRDETTGRLDFIEAQRDGRNGVHGLDKSSSATVSPDGLYLYVTGEDDNAVAVFGAAGGRKAGRLYLPAIRRLSPTLPDLVVTSLTAGTETVSLVIQNQGGRPVKETFWIDVYINPASPPTGPNQEWNKLGSEAGLVWGVTELPLVAGQSLTLTLSSPSFFPDRSSPLPVTITPGSAVYAQVDSANKAVNTGAVLERDETNNILGPVLSTAGPR